MFGGREIFEEDLKWASYVVVFEDQHVRIIHSRFKRLAKTLKIVDIDVPDRYAPLDPKLLPILQTLVKERIGLALDLPPKRRSTRRHGMRRGCLDNCVAATKTGGPDEQRGIAAEDARNPGEDRPHWPPPHAGPAQADRQRIGTKDRVETPLRDEPIGSGVQQGKRF